MIASKLLVTSIWYVIFNKDMLSYKTNRLKGVPFIILLIQLSTSISTVVTLTV